MTWFLASGRCGAVGRAKLTSQSADADLMLVGWLVCHAPRAAAGPPSAARTVPRVELRQMFGVPIYCMLAETGLSFQSLF